MRLAWPSGAQNPPSERRTPFAASGWASEAVLGPWWRCDVLATPTATTKTSWHRSEVAAELAERAALKAGAHRAVSWRYL